MSLNDINGLLKCYLDGKCSAEESRLVENWLAENGGENDEWKHMNDTARKQWLSNLYGDVQKSIQLKEEDKNIIPAYRLPAGQAGIYILLDPDNQTNIPGSEQLKQPI